MYIVKCYGEFCIYFKMLVFYFECYFYCLFVGFYYVVFVVFKYNGCVKMFNV